MEGPWNLGYRGLVPEAIARLLAPLRADTPTEYQTTKEDRALARRTERARRRTLTQRILPDTRGVGAIPIDLFGDPLSSGSEDESVATPAEALPSTRAAETQAQCLRVTHTIYGHMAWLRAAYRRFVHTARPAAAGNGADVGGHEDSDPHSPNAQTTAGKTQLCDGEACLPRETQGLPGPRG